MATLIISTNKDLEREEQIEIGRKIAGAYNGKFRGGVAWNIHIYFRTKAEARKVIELVRNGTFGPNVTSCQDV